MLYCASAFLMRKNNMNGRYVWTVRIVATPVVIGLAWLLVRPVSAWEWLLFVGVLAAYAFLEWLYHWAHQRDVAEQRIRVIRGAVDRLATSDETMPAPPSADQE